MQFTLDPATSRFLLDHRVGEQPLLPTVMALDLMARAAAAFAPDHDVVGLSDVVVGPPVIFPGDRPRTVEAVVTSTVGATPVEVVLVAADDPQRVSRYTASVLFQAHARPASPERVVRSADVLPVQIYPPYFHGPQLQVLAKAGRDGTDLVTELRAGQTLLSWPGESTVTSPTLLELWMQSCGLWELAATGRMMIPRGLEQINFQSPEARVATSSFDGVRARVRPRPSAGEGTLDEGIVFDGEVTDRAGTILLQVQGYSTVDLGHRVAADAVERVSRILGAAQVPA